jgi:hypothetical protein
VQYFLEDPDISICYPGVKNTSSVMTGAKGKAKHLIVVYVKEVYSMYCQTSKQQDLMFFAALYHKRHVLLGSSGV